MRSGTKEDEERDTKKVPVFKIEGHRKITDRAWFASCERVEKAGVFDIKGLEYGLVPVMCRAWRPCPYLVSVYARLGLHRYNLFNRRKFELVWVMKYVMSTTPLATFHITLQAIDPTSCPSSPPTRVFQICVSEDKKSHHGGFIVTCNIARLRRRCIVKDTNDYCGPKNEFCHAYNGPNSKFYSWRARSLPEWPPHNPFQNSLVKEQDKDANWIRLYLELALAIANWNTDNRIVNPSELEILKATTETMKDANEGPDADNVTVLYIRYRDLCEARVGKDVDRVAIVRRRFNKVTGWFSLAGKTLSAEIVMPKMGKTLSAEIVMPKKSKSQSSKRYLLRQRLGIHKPWRLSYPRMCKAFKNQGKNQSPRVPLFRQRLEIRKPWRLSVCKAYKNSEPSSACAPTLHQMIK